MPLKTVKGFDCGEPTPPEFVERFETRYKITSPDELTSLVPTLNPSVKLDPFVKALIVTIRQSLGPKEASFARIAIYLITCKEIDNNWHPETVAAFFRLAQVDATRKDEGHDYLVPHYVWDPDHLESNRAKCKLGLDTAEQKWKEDKEMKEIAPT